MRVLKHLGSVSAFATSVALSVFMLFLCSALLFRRVSLPHWPVLIAMSVFVSGAIALMECKSSREASEKAL